MRTRLLPLSLLLGLLLPAPPLDAAPPDPELAALRAQSQAFVRVARELTPSVVNVKTFRRGGGGRVFSDPGEEFFGPFQEMFPELKRHFPQQGRRGDGEELVQLGVGSGVIVRPEGIVLTNHHVVRDAEVVKVVLSDRRELIASVAGSDPRTDIAVLRLPPGTYPAAPLGDSARLEVGEWVIAIGNPFGLGQSVTAGIISAKGRANVGVAELEDFIQTDAAINPGNSGGPLIDLEGRVVGINSAIFSRSGGYQGIGFAVPVDMARAVMEGLLKTGRIVRSDLGVRAEKAPGDGVVVTELAAGGGAEAAGLRPGDVIVRVGERETADLQSFYRAVSLLPAGREVTVTAVRKGELLRLPVRVGDLPARPQSSPTTLRVALGFSVEELTERYADRLGFRYDRGVLVVRVDRLGAAAQAGVEPGDLVTAVNGTATPGLDAFRKAFEAIPWGSRVTLSLQRAGKTLQAAMVLSR